jgi:hypothetical protein
VAGTPPVSGSATTSPSSCASAGGAPISASSQEPQQFLDGRDKVLTVVIAKGMTPHVVATPLRGAATATSLGTTFGLKPH